MKLEFERTMLFIDKNISQGFRKTPNAKSTSRVRFEAMAVGAALALREQPDLKINNVEWLESEEFITYTTSDASNSRPRVVTRIEYARNKFLEG
ncbi:MAG: hypothetical protein V7739_12450 [Motiliproteus sp.]